MHESDWFGDQWPGKKEEKISDRENNVVEKEGIGSVKQAAGFVITWLSNYYFELMALLHPPHHHHHINLNFIAHRSFQSKGFRKKLFWN